MISFHVYAESRSASLLSRAGSACLTYQSLHAALAEGPGWHPPPLVGGLTTFGPGWVDEEPFPHAPGFSWQLSTSVAPPGLGRLPPPPGSPVGVGVPSDPHPS